MTKENPNYYSIIPANVRYDNELTPNAKLLYSEITALCNMNGECRASNNYFAKLYGVSVQSISKWISILIKKGYINSKITYKKDSKEIDKRYITLVEYPIKEKFNTPIKEKFKDNNTNKLDINNNITYSNNDYDSFVDRWNRNAKGNITRIRLLNEDRKKSLLARLKDLKTLYPDSKEDITDLFFDEIATAYSKSQFLQGKKVEGFNFDLDFVLQKSSFAKMIEGKYKDGAK